MCGLVTLYMWEDTNCDCLFHMGTSLCTVDPPVLRRTLGWWLRIVWYLLEMVPVSFLWKLNKFVASYHILVLSYSFADGKSDVALTGLKSRCGQACALLWQLVAGGGCFLASPASRACCHLLPMAPCHFQSSLGG